VGGGGDLPLNKTDDVEDGEVRVFLFFLICPPSPSIQVLQGSGAPEIGAGAILEVL